MFTEVCNAVFDGCIRDYHLKDDVDSKYENPFSKEDIKHLLYEKCRIDTVQWHLEDVIRNPDIDPAAALRLKRRIDKSNQDRTDMVEYLDAHFLAKYKGAKVAPDAGINTESPAWAIDRLSILALKIYHMRMETLRKDARDEHIVRCNEKLNVLLEQRNDLSTAIQELLTEIGQGKKYMKVYKQMKMYNDESLNPVLYGKVK